MTYEIIAITNKYLYGRLEALTGLIAATEDIEAKALLTDKKALVMESINRNLDWIEERWSAYGLKPNYSDAGTIKFMKEVDRQVINTYVANPNLRFSQIGEKLNIAPNTVSIIISNYLQHKYCEVA